MGRARDIANATTASTANAVVKRDGTGAIVGLSTVTRQVFSTAGANTWTKPATGTVAFIQVWGAGGGGASNAQASAAGGGGGGSYVERLMPLSALGPTETVTVGAGGASRSTAAAGFIGGNSSFGSHVTAYGGIGGSITASEYALGASVSRAGVRIATSALTITDYPDALDRVNSGGMSGTSVDPIAQLKGSLYGGGAGFSRTAGNASSGYAAGASAFGGSGGAFGVAGAQPGGGGGGGNTTTPVVSGVGGDGRVIVTVW